MGDIYLKSGQYGKAIDEFTTTLANADMLDCNLFAKRR